MKKIVKKEATVCVHRTIHENLEIKITLKAKKISGFLMTASAVETRTNKSFKEIRRCTKQIRSEEEISSAEQILKAKITGIYEEKILKICRSDDKDGIFSNAFDRIPEVERVSFLCSSHWSKKTALQYLRYMRRNIIPHMDQSGISITQEEINLILEKMTEKATSNSRGYGDSEFSRHGTVKKHAEAFNLIYENLRRFTLEEELPEIVLPVPGGQQQRKEQMKEVPEDVRIRFSALLMRSIDNGLTMGAIFMMTGLLRDSEACAIYFEDIQIDPSGNFGVYEVTKQLKDGEIVKSLKTDNGYRRVIFPQFTIDCLESRRRYLLKKGFSETDIPKMLVVSDSNNPEQIADLANLSNLVIQLLLLAHFVEANIKDAEQALVDEPDIMEDGTRISHVSPYMLRRMCCTLFTKCCGLDPELVAYMMGHRLPDHVKKQWSLYMKNPENHRKIAQKIERVIWNPDYSENPMFSPITVDDTQLTSARVDYQVQKLKLPKGFKGKIMIQTREPASVISARMPEGILSSVIPIPIVNEDLKLGLPIGRLMGEDEYRKLVKECDAIALQEDEEQ